MKITLEWLESQNACTDAVEAWKRKGCESDPITVVRLAMDMGHFDWANWLIVRCMKYKQYVAYAIFAAEQVLEIYEKKYPGDKRSRNAIETAKKCLSDPSRKNKDAAYAAYSAAYSSASSAYADAAAYSAAYAASSASSAYAYADAAAYSAAYAASSASSAYADAAAYSAAYAARKSMQAKIIEYGISLLK